MTSYVFRMEGHASAPERVELQFGDPAEARANAAIAIGDMLSKAGAGFWNGPGWHVDVTDESGRVICSLSVQGRATDAPRATAPATPLRVRRAMPVMTSKGEGPSGPRRWPSAAAG